MQSAYAVILLLRSWVAMLPLIWHRYPTPLVFMLWAFVSVVQQLL